MRKLLPLLLAVPLIQAGNISDFYRNRQSAFQLEWTSANTERILATVTHSEAAEAWPDQPDTLNLVTEAGAILWQLILDDYRFLFTADGTVVHVSYNEDPKIHEQRLWGFPMSLGLVGDQVYPGATLRHLGFKLQNWTTPTPTFIQNLLQNSALLNQIRLHPRMMNLVSAFGDDGIAARLQDDGAAGPMGGTYISHHTLEFETIDTNGYRVTRGQNELTGERFHHHQYQNRLDVVDVTQYQTHKTFSQRQNTSPIVQVIALDYSECLRLEDECQVVASVCINYALQAREFRRIYRLCFFGGMVCEQARRNANQAWENWHRCIHDYMDCNARVEACIIDVQSGQ